MLHDSVSPSQSRLSRGLPKSLQLVILGLLALAAVAVLGVAPQVWSHFTAREQAAAPPAVAPGTFRPTEAQWAALKFAPVEETIFRQARVTDGKIAHQRRHDHAGLLALFGPGNEALRQGRATW